MCSRTPLVPRLQILVVFEDRPDGLWLRWLRPGFRHCFCLLRSERGWILCDSRGDGFDILPAPDCGVEPLARSYARLGGRVLGLSRPPRRPPFPLAPFTCVELVKRVLGLRAPWLVTPYALYRHLLRQPECLLRAAAA